MSKIEEILYNEINLSTTDHFRDKMIKVCETASLAFTKWKDDNYHYRHGDFFWKSGVHFADGYAGKPLEQLFDEWNNLKTT